jgi:hypothetical protein
MERYYSTLLLKAAAKPSAEQLIFGRLSIRCNSLKRFRCCFRYAIPKM